MRKLTLALVVLGMCLWGSAAFADGVDEYTKLLLHNDGAGFVDSSPSNHPVTNNGVQLDTVNKEFCTGSAYFQGGSYDGQQYFSGNYLSIPESNDWHLGTGDFTIDFWFNIQNTGARFPMLYQGSNGDNFWRLEWDKFSPAGSQLAFEMRQNGVWGFEHRANWLPLADTWYHLAEVRSGNTLYMFLDGDLQNSVSYNSSIPDSVGPLEVGRVPLIAGGYTYTNGDLDEIRISKGMARWTSDFTPL